jgi:hypothetical protein
MSSIRESRTPPGRDGAVSRRRALPDPVLDGAEERLAHAVQPVGLPVVTEHATSQAELVQLPLRSHQEVAEIRDSLGEQRRDLVKGDVQPIGHDQMMPRGRHPGRSLQDQLKLRA